MTAVNNVSAPTDHDEYLQVIAEISNRIEANQRDLKAAVMAARHASPKPVPWERIGAAIGITRQAAAERFTTRRRHR